ncbi:class I SAM-dependent methyltransferase [Methylosinus sporium]|uniref:Class I SAM-dependent methyltransferase n=1 Tax=Methylosinus sporium TaxID=428 RepID=A0A549SCX0_METSR|nr:MULTISPECIES: class I SAM-dependent methyltransferase [Methylosinus]MBU3891028.1 class I SAM-dependent methyltransferase [Methylosinus sp. KRF6]TRL23894.1 class I SAM-dependent methyltransferase [Methylosinus sporium]
MILDKPRSNLVLAPQLIAEIAAKNPMHSVFVGRALAGLAPDEMDRFEQYLCFCAGNGTSIDYIAESYLTVVQDTIAEQMYFFRHGRYRHSTFEQVAEFVYNNSDYMNRYMYGLVITAFLWPNHVEMARFFAGHLPRDRRGAYLEIGPGHGYYMMTAVSQSSYDDFTGVDISQASVAQTGALIRFFTPDAVSKVSLYHCDFLVAETLPRASFDAIVMGEVLEHVESPELFLGRIAELARPGAFIYVTTCINAPAIDHIYLWRTVEELESVIVRSGLEIERDLRLPHDGATLEQAMTQKLSINVAYVLRKP